MRASTQFLLYYAHLPFLLLRKKCRQLIIVSFIDSIQPTVSADVMSSIDCPPSLYFKMIQIEY